MPRLRRTRRPPGARPAPAAPGAPGRGSPTAGRHSGRSTAGRGLWALPSGRVRCHPPIKLHVPRYHHDEHEAGADGHRKRRGRARRGGTSWRFDSVRSPGTGARVRTETRCRRGSSRSPRVRFGSTRPCERRASCWRRHRVTRGRARIPTPRRARRGAPRDQFVARMEGTMVSSSKSGSSCEQRPRSLGVRCDDITRLIDEALADLEGAAAGQQALQRAGRHGAQPDH